MDIFRDSKQLQPHLKAGSSLTVGTFDGVHLGHKKLLEFTVSEARKRGLKSVVVTFEPHPVYVLRPEIKVERIALPEEKIQRLSKFGLDYLLILNFNTKLANLRTIKFFADILVGDLNARFIALGYNHTFGKDREGNLDFLEKIAPEWNVSVSAVEPFFFDDEPVSSSRIRKAIKEGEVEKANKMLYESFTIPGVIMKGKGLGQKLGYPTINIKVDKGKLMPGPGVYAATCEIGGRDIKGMMYVHPVPESCDIEINLFDFNGDLYDQRTVVRPLKFTREAEKFPDNEALSNQLAKDEDEIKQFFGIH